MISTRHVTPPRTIPCAVAALVLLGACHDLGGTPPLPDGYTDPAAYNTPTGALQLAIGTVGFFRGALSNTMMETGMLTDELTGKVNVATQTLGVAPEVDDRTNIHNTGVSAAAYTYLQQVRGQARLARSALHKYAPAVSPAVQGELFAVEGYADVLLADLYCSGVPLSTVDFEQNFTYHAGSSTADVYRTAAALFDSSLTLAGDSARSTLSADRTPVSVLARVGMGRALLALGLTDSAARVVASVSDTATYHLHVSFIDPSFRVLPKSASVSDREGRSGLPYRSSNDPRTATIETMSTSGNFPDVSTFASFVPVLYLDQSAQISADTVNVLLASGVEARLIEAEADLKQHGTQWLTILNRLRTNGETSVTLRTGVPGVSPGPVGYPDTTWGPGTGVGLIAPSVLTDVTPQCDPGDPANGVPAPTCQDTVWYRGLHPLSDPGIGLTEPAATRARVALVFRERAYWLFLSAHRQGDARRLVRSPVSGGYGWPADSVYPTGPYTATSQYGKLINLDVPESNANPLFKGCLNHDA